MSWAFWAQGFSQPRERLGPETSDLGVQLLVSFTTGFGYVGERRARELFQLFIRGLVVRVGEVSVHGLTFAHSLTA